MKKFFPSWQKSVGMVALTVFGLIAYKAVDAFTGVEQEIQKVASPKPKSPAG